MTENPEPITLDEEQQSDVTRRMSEDSSSSVLRPFDKLRAGSSSFVVRRPSSVLSRWPLFLGLVILLAIVGWTAWATIRSSQADAARPTIAKLNQRAPEIKLHLLEN